MFATTRWNTFPNIWSQMSRLHNELGHGRSETPAVRVNAWEDEGKLFIETDLPGLSLEDIEILVEGGNELTIRGERQRPEEDEGNWLRQERLSGRFERSFRLPFEVDVDKIDALLKDGVLRVELPKRDEDLPRKIEIKSA